MFYERPNNDVWKTFCVGNDCYWTECIQDECTPRQYRKAKGKCGMCNTYESRSLDDETKCAVPTCSESEEITEGGICKPCPEYQRRQEGYKCDTYRCDKYERKLKDGKC